MQVTESSAQSKWNAAGTQKSCVPDFLGIDKWRNYGIMHATVLKNGSETEVSFSESKKLNRYHEGVMLSGESMTFLFRKETRR